MTTESPEEWPADSANGDGATERSVTLRVPEMDCPTCARTVTDAVSAVSGVETVRTRPASGTVVVEFETVETDRPAVIDAIERAGYAVVDDHRSAQETSTASNPAVDRPAVWRRPRGMATLVAGILLALGLGIEFLLAGRNVSVVEVVASSIRVSGVMYLAATAAGGWIILGHGVRSARALRLDIDFLMSAAIMGAITASVLGGAVLYLEAATLAVLFNVAELLETRAMNRARSSLRELLELAPNEATVIRDPESDSPTEETIPADTVTVGDVVAIRPGERVPVDGEVVSGTTAVDESPVTGESVPVDKGPGDELYAGSINEGGYLEVRATAAGDESTLARMTRLVAAAEERSTDHERFVDRFSSYYTPVMVAVAIALAAGPPVLLGAPWVPWFVAGITMLVLACPCAFVISTPVSVVSGITAAARNGVLVKGGDHLEAMGNVDVIAMDKTGTLTRGELTVTDVIPVGDRTVHDVLRCARGVEQRSEHPIASAVVERADGAGVASVDVQAFENRAGEGVTATVDGVDHYAGKPGLFNELGFDLRHVHAVDPAGEVSDEIRDRCERAGCLNLLADTIPRLRTEGKTVVVVGRSDEIEGVLAVADEVRPDAKAVIQRLRALGVRPVMVTGDNERTAKAVGEAVGIDDIRADLMPEEKVAAVESLETDGTVAMVGDGVNDAPALATATVGIAMGAAGTDTAIETADVALLGDDLSRLPYLLELSQRANRVIRQNIWSSLGVKAVLAIGVPLQIVGVAIAVLVGDAGMTIGVTGNAMRLANVRPTE